MRYAREKNQEAALKSRGALAEGWDLDVPRRLGKLPKQVLLS